MFSSLRSYFSFLQVLIALCLLSALSLWSFEPRTVQAGFTEQAIAIDGEFNESAWQSAHWNSGFIKLADTRPSEVQTRFKVLHDNNYIYFALSVDEPQMAQLKAEADGVSAARVFLDDCIEIFLDPNQYRVEYFHIIVNSLGVVDEGKCTQLGHYRDQGWSSGIKTAAQRFPEAWQLELALPLLNLELTENSLQGWKFNVVRERYAGGRQELSSFANVQVFTQMDRFAHLELMQAETHDFFWEISALPGGKIVQQDAGLFYCADLMLCNKSGKLRTAWLESRLKGSGETAAASSREGFLFNPGETVKAGICLPVSAEFNGTLELFLGEDKEGSKLLASRSFPLALSYSPLKIALTSPAYRNSMFSTLKCDSIAGDISLALTDADLKNRILEVTLSAQAGGGGIVRTQLPVLAKHMSFSLPIPELAAGDYVLSAELKGMGEKQHLHRVEQLIKCLPAASQGNEVSFDSNGACYVNGRPFMPFGMFNHFNPHIRDKRFNVVHLYCYITRELLDVPWAEGQYVVAQPFQSIQDFNTVSPRKNPDQMYSDEELETIRRAVEKHRGHPALLAWYLEDEPGGRRVIPERLKQAYELIRETDPYHPVIVLEDSARGQEKYVDCADILMPDSYPGFLRGGLAARGIDRVSVFVRSASTAGLSRKPVWFTPQWFSWWDVRFSSNPQQREPYFNELRNMNYQAVIEGAKGFIGFTAIGWKHYADFRVGIPFLAEEMALLQEAILAVDLKDAISFDAGNSESFLCSYRQSRDRRYVFAVNATEQDREVRFRLRDKYSGILYRVSEASAVEVKDGVFNDFFRKYESRIYCEEAELAQKLSLAQAEAEINSLKSSIGPMAKPGNHAYWENGVKASASSEGWLRQAVHAIDGMNSMNVGEDDYAPHIFWQPAQKGGSSWLLLEFAQAVSIKRCRIYSPNIQDFVLQSGSGEVWTNHPGRVSQDGDLFEVVFPESFLSDNLRLFIKSDSEATERSIVHEIEVYSD